MRWQRLRSRSEREALELGGEPHGADRWPLLTPYAVDAVWAVHRAVLTGRRHPAGRRRGRPGAAAGHPRRPRHPGHRDLPAAARAAVSLVRPTGPGERRRGASAARPLAQAGPRQLPAAAHRLVRPAARRRWPTRCAGYWAPAPGPTRVAPPPRPSPAPPSCAATRASTTSRGAARPTASPPAVTWPIWRAWSATPARTAAAARVRSPPPTTPSWRTAGPFSTRPGAASTPPRPIASDPLVSPFDPGREIPWVWGHSLRDDRPLLVPARIAHYSAGVRRGQLRLRVLQRLRHRQLSVGGGPLRPARTGRAGRVPAGLVRPGAG